jgi:parvulin-like peptidyl-prolyl isomerase
MRTLKAGLLAGVIFSAMALTIMPMANPAAAEEEAKQREPEIKGFPAPDKVLATVNGAKITVLMHEVSVNALVPYVNYHQTVPDERMVAIRKKALENLIDDALFLEEAERRDINIGKDEIDKGVEEVKTSLPPGLTLDKALERSHMTMKDLRDDIKHKAMINRVKEERRREVYDAALKTVTDEYMLDYYEKNLEKFVLPEKFRTSEILLKTDPAGGNRALETVVERANEIKKRADAGENFAELAKAYSQASNASKGGDAGWSHKGSLPEYYAPIEAYVDTMKVGEVSEPIRTLYGLHIVKLEARAEKAQMKFEELNKEKLRKELAASEATRQWEAWRTGLRSGAKIVYYEVE